MTKKNVTDLRPQQRQAAVLLAEGYTHSEVAAELNIGERTVDRWANTPAIVDAVNEHASNSLQDLAQRFARHREQLFSLVPLAILSLREIFDVPTDSKSAAAKLAASRLVLQSLPEPSQPQAVQVVVTAKEVEEAIRRSHEREGERLGSNATTLHQAP